eukprot:365139-Chlamydomonas_euryale.AAC.24
MPVWMQLKPSTVIGSKAAAVAACPDAAQAPHRHRLKRRRRCCMPGCSSSPALLFTQTHLPPPACPDAAQAQHSCSLKRICRRLPALMQLKPSTVVDSNTATATCLP